MIEITKQQALVLASLGYALAEVNGIESQTLEDFLDENEEALQAAADKYGTLSVDDTSALILDMFKKGIAND